MNISKKVVKYLIRKDIIKNDDFKIYEYGTFVLLYNLFLIVNIIFIGIIIDKFEYSIIFLLAWTPYRIFMGGSHCSTVYRCWIFFILYFLFGIFIYLYIDHSYIILFNIFLMILQITKRYYSTSFILIWILYFINISLLSTEVSKIISIAYLLNSFLTLYKFLLNKKYIF